MQTWIQFQQHFFQLQQHFSNYTSIFNKAAFCLGEKQGTGMLINGECSSW